MLKKSLSDGGIQNFRLKIRAYDLGVPVKYGEVEVEIAVQRNQFPPEFIGAPYVIEASENTVNNTGIFTIKAEDEDMRGQIIYEVIGVTPADRFFRVGRTTGFLYVSGDLKSDTTLTYLLIIQAYDSANPGQKVTAEASISVKRNENAPRFEQNAYSKTITANTFLGSNIISIIATDSDVKDVMQYTILSDDKCNEYFYINPGTGLIYLKKLLNDPSITAFECNIEASDRGYPKARSASVILKLDIERNIELPRFTQEQYTVAISESVVVNSVFLTIRAQLSNVVNVIVYEITGQYPAPDFIGINRTTGQLYILRDLRLDSLQLNSYTVTLNAYDQATPNSIGQSTVFVEVRRNVNKPTFPSPSITVSVNPSLEQGTIISTVTAQDQDSTDNLYYSLVGDAVAMNFFYVDTANGTVSLKRSIANDNNNRYQV